VEKALGIGGLFFRSKDPAALGAWYRDHLGFELTPWGGVVFPLRHEEDRGGACVVWSPFKADTSYFGSSDNAFMLNVRVRDLDAMRKQLIDSGCNVDEKVDVSDHGKFGWVTDPEGRRIELWEPPEKHPGS
jgi:uncharacterized glyoxalase superfamily protein PhnB